MIKAYEKAIQLQNSDVAKTLASDTNKCSQPEASDSEASDSNKGFKVGDLVRATYDVDGLDYEAEIKSIDDGAGACVVKYIGYNNEQTVRLEDLIDSWGEEERNKQHQDAAEAASDVDADADENNVDCPVGQTIFENPFAPKQSTSFPPMPPMPPMINEMNTDEAEHFSAMLMSWYMSGYYTGLYQGHRMAKTKSRRSNKGGASTSKRKS